MHVDDRSTPLEETLRAFDELVGTFLGAVFMTGGLFLYGVLQLRTVVPGAPAYAAWAVPVLIALAFASGSAYALALRGSNPKVYASIGR